MTPFRILVVSLFAFSATGCEQRQANPANPPGTAATRALDRAAGSNASGAYPMQSQGAQENPPGTAAERAVDRSAGTNVSGAYPMQSDGMPSNPPGTAAGRLLDREVGKTGSR
jgi:hypothetical protein